MNIKILFLLIANGFHVFGFCQSDPKIVISPSNEFVFDGKLDEAFWNASNSYTDFKLVEPRLGGTPTEKVKAFISYNQNYLLVAFKCSYKDITKLYANSLERDLPLLTDDYVEFQIDSYNDKNSALIFRTNAEGARYDAEISNNGEILNSSWDAIWDAMTNKTDSGWTAEFRIPFYSLRFDHTELTTMRFKLIAYYKSINEKLIYPLVNDKVSPVLYHYENFQDIQFTSLKSSRPVFITPYVKTDVAFRRELNPTNTAYIKRSEWLTRKNYSSNASLDKVLSNVGLDLKFRMKNNNLDVTLNTDFAQAEGDDRLVNVTRFSITTPEKRMFFLENNEFFSSERFGHRLFNSRQAGLENGLTVPIIGGIRFTGISGTDQYGLMSVFTKEIEDKNIEGYNMSVLRWRKTLDKRASNIGVLLTGKISTSSSKYNYTTGIDGSWRWKNNYRVYYTLASTFDDKKGNFKPAYGIGINTFKPNGLGFEYRFWNYNENFSPGLGFLSEPNARTLILNTGFRKSYRKQQALTYLSFGHYIKQSWVSSTDDKSFFQTNIYITMIFRSGFQFTGFIPMYIIDNIHSPWKFSGNVTIPKAQYKMWKINPIFSSGNAFRINGTLDVQLGEFYGGTQKTADFFAGYDFSRNFRLEVGGSWNQFTFPKNYFLVDKTKESIGRLYTRAKLSFSSRSFLNLYTQYDNVQKKITWNLRYRYMPKEGTNLYVVFNVNTNTDLYDRTPAKPAVDNQLVIIKFSKTFASL